MTVFQIGEPYNLLRSTNTAAVKEHLMITVFGKGQYGVVTIGFPDLIFYFLFSLFFVHPVQLLTAPNIFDALTLLWPPEAPQRASRTFQGARLIAIRLMLKTAPRRSQRAILLLFTRHELDHLIMPFILADASTDEQGHSVLLTAHPYRFFSSSPYLLPRPCCPYRRPQ